jgi:glycerol transport system ATP-binding protein
MATIELVGVAHAYEKGKQAVQNINLRWEQGSSNALLGPSGCGKTTLLKIISGLLKPTEGQVLLDGVDVTQNSPRERNIAQVFQFPVVYETLNVYDNLAFPLRNRGVPGHLVKVQVQEMAEVLELSHLLKKNAASLGAAEKQLISLGRGIIREDLAGILLDEPLTVIDPHHKWHLRRKLKQLRERFQVTMIYVTHDQREALTFADQVTVMNLGETLQTGSPQQLHDDPQAPFVGYFIGSPGMNIFPASIKDGSVYAGDFGLPLPSAINGAGDLKIGIRPEFVRLSTSSQDGWMKCTVQAAYMTGSSKILDLHGSGLNFKARAAESSRFHSGDTVWALFPPDATKLYVNDRAVSKEATV